VSPASQYKKIENKFVEDLKKHFRKIRGRISVFFRNVMTTGKQRFTVMFIPHSEKKIFNFRISVFALIFLAFLTFSMFISSFVIITWGGGFSKFHAKTESKLRRNEARLEKFYDSLSDWKTSLSGFKSELYDTLSVVDGEYSEMDPAIADMGGNDISSFSSRSVSSGSDNDTEIIEINSLIKELDGSVDALHEITNLLVSHKELLLELPTEWPLKDVRGRITAKFGPAEHPFDHVWYLHMGVDIAAWGTGVEIVATASGKVVEKDYSKGFGNYIVIRHKYGFSTKYAHLASTCVNEGDIVNQGDVIGVMGNTGLSTGTHLHYEVRIGSQVVDPERYLNIKKWAGNSSG